MSYVCRQGLLGTLLAPLRAATPSGRPSGNVIIFYTLLLLTGLLGILHEIVFKCQF
jgi:hypothetical protein